MWMTDQLVKEIQLKKESGVLMLANGRPVSGNKKADEQKGVS